MNLATLLRIGRHGLTDDLTGDELEGAYTASELIAFSGLAARRVAAIPNAAWRSH